MESEQMSDLDLEPHEPDVVEPEGAHEKIRDVIDSQLEDQYLALTWRSEDGCIATTIGYRTDSNAPHHGVVMPPVIYEIAADVGLTAMQSRTRDTHDPNTHESQFVGADFLATGEDFPEDFTSPTFGPDDSDVVVL